MEIEVSFYGNLIKYRTKVNELRNHIQIPGGMSISGYLKFLNIPEQNIKALCNGKKVESGYILQENDYLQLYSLHSGG